MMSFDVFHDGGPSWIPLGRAHAVATISYTTRSTPAFLGAGHSPFLTIPFPGLCLLSIVTYRVDIDP